jgi:hypothetical protein
MRRQFDADEPVSIGLFVTQSGTFRRNANLTVAKLAYAMPHSRD